VLIDIKAQRVYRELPAELRDRIEDGLRTPAPLDAAPATEAVELPAPTTPEPTAPAICPLCGGPGCDRCKPPAASLTPPKPRKRPGPPPQKPRPKPPQETPLEALEREAPDDLAAGRRLLLTKTGLSAKKLAMETGTFFGQKPRADRILTVFQSEVIKVGPGRYCFKHVDRSKAAPENQAHPTAQGAQDTQGAPDSTGVKRGREIKQ